MYKRQVQSMLNGTKEEIFADVQKCIELGNSAEKGFHLTTGCDIPDGTSPEKVDWFMEAARLYEMCIRDRQYSVGLNKN